MLVFEAFDDGLAVKFADSLMKEARDLNNLGHQDIKFLSDRILHSSILDHPL